MHLIGTGVWSGQLRYGDRAAATDAAAELEAAGYTALWVPDVGGDLFPAVEALLAATSKVQIATGILNVWMHTAEETGDQHRRLVGTYGDRFVVGLGISHAPLIDQRGAGTYRRPLAKMREYLDAADASGLPRQVRVLAALGEQMLALARDRTAGAHPYLVTPEHTHLARGILGPDSTLAPEQGVVLETDPTRARQIARAGLAGYLGLPNYANNWKRLGFTDDDIADGGSDRLVDALFAWGDETAIAKRVQAHRDAGADHVCIQVLTPEFATFPMPEWRRLAAALT